MPWWAILIIIVAVILVIIWLVALYNRLVRLRVEVQQGWANIDVQHERGVFQAVTEARTAAMDARGPAEAGQANNMLARALGGLFAVAENYPDLKASSNFLQLQTELANVEEMLAAARRYYNSTVAQYNATQHTVPSNVVAKFGSFSDAEFFEEDEDAVRSAPQVSFDR